MTRSITVTIHDIDLEVYFEYYKGSPGRLHAAPEDCYPEEPPELELESVCIDEVNIMSLMDEDILDMVVDKILKHN